MGCFEWISPRPLPAAFDLRRRGWRLRGAGAVSALSAAGLVDARDPRAVPDDFPEIPRGRAFALGIGESGRRARWIAAGFADALGDDVGLDELEQRVRRSACGGPADVRRVHGRLTLDLVVRDARVDARRLNLHPREFALLWRLTEARGRAVAREALLRDVFDLAFDPGTNRIAVHICRLRKKLAHAGLDSLLVTGPGDGAYRLVLPRPEPATRGALAEPWSKGQAEAATA